MQFDILRRLGSTLHAFLSQVHPKRLAPTRWLYALVGFSLIFQLSSPATAGPAPEAQEDFSTSLPAGLGALAQHPEPIPVERGSTTGLASGFIENAGQFDDRVQFQMATEDGYVIISDDALWVVSNQTVSTGAFGLQSEEPTPESTPSPGADEAMEAARRERGRLVYLKVQFPGSEAPLTLEPFDPVETNLAFIKGSDPERWVAGAPVWRGVRIHDLAPGYALELSREGASWIWNLVEVEELRLQGQQQEQPSPQGEPRALQLLLSGADLLSLEGNRIAAVIGGEVLEVDLPAILSEDRETSRVPSARLGGDQLTIELDPPEPGGSDGSGESSGQPGFLVSRLSDLTARSFDPHQPPTSSGQLLSLTREEVAVPAQLSQPIYSILLGGGQDERAHAMAIHPASGEIFVTGRSHSFPIILDDFLVEGDDDAYVLRLTPQGEVVTLTYLGGNIDEGALDVTLLDSGELILIGRTDSNDFPTTADGFQRTRAGLIDTFVVMLSPSTVELEYGSYFGGTGFDYAYGLESDPEKPTRVYFTGMTTSTEATFPLRDPIDGVHDGIQDAYLVQFDVSRSGSAALEFSTYLGGSDSDQGHDLGLGPDGILYLTGQTVSDDLFADLEPDRSLDPTYNGEWDSFLIGLDLGEREVVYGSYLGGEGNDCEVAGDFRECRIVIGPTGLVYLAGMTGSDSFPTTTGVYQRDNVGADDIYITVLNPGLDGDDALVRSTLVGGHGDDLAFGLAVSAAGQPVVVGRTTSDDLELTEERAIRTTFAGGHEAFALVLSQDLSQILYGTYIGGDEPDGATPVLIDSSGNLHVGGFTFSSDFEVTHGDDSIDGISDAFVVGIDPGLPSDSNVSIELIDTEGQPISSVALNADGWPTPNPLTVKVTISCPPGGNDCSSPFDLELTGGGIGRYYVYEGTLLPDGAACVGDSPSQQTTYASFSLSCEAIFVQSGSSVSHIWRVWVQPSEQSTLQGQATYGPGNDQANVGVPQAQIHPVVVIPGLMGSMKGFSGEWVADPIFHTYDTLIEELQLVGYEDGVSLFTFAYDWRQHLPDTGEELSQAISRFLDNASKAERTYVLTDSVDLVGHSLGGLVSRAYVQSSSYDNDVHRLITLGTPHLGAPRAYLAAEGLDFGDFPQGLVTDTVLRALALKHGYCILVVSPIIVTCVVTDSHLHAYMNDQVPSLREIFPDRNYQAESAAAYLVSAGDDDQGYPFGVQVNTFLEELNRGVDVLVERLGAQNAVAFVGNREVLDTHVFYRIVERFFWQAPLWENGRIRSGAQFRPPGPGDQTVPVSSANLTLVDARVQKVEVALSDDGSTEILHRTMPTQLQQSVVEMLTRNRPPFDGGFADPAFDIQGAVMIINLSPVEMHVTDPTGRKVGMDFQTGSEVNEIPAGFFGRSELPDEPDFIYIPDPVEGDYKLDLMGIAEGEYRVRLEVLTEGGALVPSEVTGSTSPGERHSHTLDYSPDNLPNLPLTLEWRPPIQTEEEPWQTSRNSTLPIRFRVHDTGGNFVVDHGVLIWVADLADPSRSIAAFTAEGSDNIGQSDVVRIDPAEEQYVVNLHLRDYSIEVGRTYLVGVMVFGRQLGMTAFTVEISQAPHRNGAGPSRWERNR